MGAVDSRSQEVTSSSGTFLCARGPSTPSGTGILSLDAPGVPVRNGVYPDVRAGGRSGGIGGSEQRIGKKMDDPGGRPGGPVKRTDGPRNRLGPGRVGRSGTDMSPQS